VSHVLKIFIAGKNKMNNKMLADFITKSGFETQLVDLDSELSRSEIQDGLLLIDIGGFSQDIWDVISLCKATGVSVVLCIPQGNSSLKKQSFESEVLAVLEKPIKTAELMAIIKSVRA